MMFLALFDLRVYRNRLLNTFGPVVHFKQKPENIEPEGKGKEL